METVKVVLKYNPYIKKTEILFNGKKPRINSLVEKYSSDILQDWLCFLPEIFKDEMNGYDFKLIYSGTEIDYKELVNAFRIQKVACLENESVKDEFSSKDYVCFDWDNKLESYDVKMQKIDNLIEWLKNCQFDNFNYSDFLSSNEELLYGDYPFVVLGNIDIDKENTMYTGVSIECVDSVISLESTNIYHTPIVVIVNEQVILYLPKIISELQKMGAGEKQIFFLIDESLQNINVERIIVDLGINNPQIVSSLYDEKIKMYLIVYPYSDYIRDTLAVLEHLSNDLEKPIKEAYDVYTQENADYVIALDANEKKINTSKAVIAELKDSRCQIYEELVFSELSELEKNLNNWKSNKTVITNDESAAHKAAVDYEKLIKQQVGKVLNDLCKYREEQIQRINVFYNDKCRIIDGFDKEKSIIDEPQFKGWEQGNNIVESLLCLLVEKDVPYDSMYKDKKFKSKNHPEYVHVIQFFFNDWRDWVKDNVVDNLQKSVMDTLAKIKEYENQISQACTSQIEQILLTQIENKNEMANRLDSTYQEIQKNMNWIEEFNSYINSIEKD